MLCEIKQFEPFEFFEQLKTTNNKDGCLTLRALTDYIITNEIKVSESEMGQFLKSLQTKNDDRLTYSEFLLLILPNKKTKLRQKVLVR